jgi:acetolactate synthase-1/2/3 large subunit
MVRQWQQLFYSKRYSGSILTPKDRLPNEGIAEGLKYDYLPDIVKLAEAHGAKAYRVIDPAKLDAVISKAVKSDATTLVEVIVEPRANVYPMIPAGKPVSDMVFD